MDEIPHKRLGFHVNVFAKKLKVVQHRDCRKYADVAYHGSILSKQIPIIESMFNKLSENLYFIEISIDSLQTISV